MSMQKWTDEELAATQEQLEAWQERHNNSGGSGKLWLFTALLGAFAISTGFAFIFFDGVTALSIILMVLGSITCFSWYKSEKQRKDNVTFLEEVNKELKHRKKKAGKSKLKADANTNQDKVEEQDSASVSSEESVDK